MQKKISIKSRLIVLIVICCLFPMILLITFQLHYMNSNHFENKISQQISQLKYSDQTTMERLQQIIQYSREFSYDGVIPEEYDKYVNGEITKRKLLMSSTYYLIDKYSRKDAVQAAILWFQKNPEKLYCGTYNETVDGGYHQIQKYWDSDHRMMVAYANQIGTSAKFVGIEDRLYLIRNILNDNYEKIGVFVLRLNKRYCLEQYEAFDDGVSVTVEIDRMPLQLSGTKVTETETGYKEMGGSAGYSWENGILSMYHHIHGNDFEMKTFVRFDDSAVFQPFYGYQEILVGLVLCFIFILVALIHIFTKHVSKPIEKILDGAEKIRSGSLGFQIEYEPDNKEFQHMTDAFNQMSRYLKKLFDHIYEEELLLRDAKICALQSRLNPHFMNNTLEIINWEARLSGNEKVSKMIEALAVIMDAGIDRKQEPEVLLSEELVFVDAYLYIISERFGDRLQVEKDFPEEILDRMVPRLILQPLLENAVEYGAGQRYAGPRKIVIRGYEKEKYLCLEIINEGILDEDSKIKITHLLNGEYEKEAISSGSMGIANVHQRLRILYGEPCGLEIEQIDNGHVCARLIVLSHAYPIKIECDKKLE